MKASVLISLITVFIILSCKTSMVDKNANIDTLVFYDFKKETITIADIIDLWEKRIQQNEGVDNKIINLEVLTIQDAADFRDRIILLATTKDNTTKTATLLKQYKKGYILSNKTVTCKNCSFDVRIALSNGNWSCVNNNKVNSNCTKIETATID